MKNVFDAHNNFDEWFENDWESDEYIKNTKSSGKKNSGDGNWKFTLLFTIVFSVVVYASCSACFGS